MSFSDYIKTIKLEVVEEKLVPYVDIKCQYNPDRWKAWRSVCGDTLSIEKSPHYAFLDGDYEPYEKMQKLYGRNDVWVINKVLKFEGLIDSVLSDSIREMPIVLDKPLVDNPYSNGYTIWEGHHRLAIAMYYMIETKVQICRVV